MPQTLGQYWLNSVLPEKHRSSDTVDKKVLTRKLTAMAKEDPISYVDIVANVKRVGDEISTLEGVSVGLDDIVPVYKTRDHIMLPAAAKIKAEKDPKKREAIILAVQDQMLAHTNQHPGTMTQMAQSGARGNIPQLMKTVASPVASVDAKGSITPWLITKSYSEGLSPAEYWVTGNEARINTVKSTTSVSEPGDVSKIIVNTMYPQVITLEDCGTKNGLEMAAADSHVLGRYLSENTGHHKRNTLISSSVASDLRKAHPLIHVRSPMLCEAREGVCKKCQGHDEKGQDHAIGINVGVRAANALSEPLTQFVLNAKHGVRVLKGAAKALDGLPGVRQMVEIPQTFFNKAAIAELHGTVDRIEPAAHGGTFIYVNGTEHYAAPNLAVLVKRGQTVEAGDVLSEGVPKPDEIVHHKGLGAGRAYLVSALHGLYKQQGIDVDKRHLELLARSHLNHVQITDESKAHPDLIKGDIVAYGSYKKSLSRKTERLPTRQAVGHVLGTEVMHYTVGTPITPTLATLLQSKGVTHVDVAVDAPKVEFIMKPITRAPLLNPDWMARMAHRFLKENLLKAAHTGGESDYHSVHPVPAYAHGAEFGQGRDGRY